MQILARFCVTSNYPLKIIHWFNYLQFSIGLSDLSILTPVTDRPIYRVSIPYEIVNQMEPYYWTKKSMFFSLNNGLV